MLNKKLSLFDKDFNGFVDGFPLKNSNWIFYLIYLKELKNNGEKKLCKKENFTKMYLEIQIKICPFLRYFIR